MKLTAILLLFTSTMFQLAYRNEDSIAKVFFDLNLSSDINELFSQVEQSDEFALEFSKKELELSGEFRAKYIGDSNIYSNADSVKLLAVVCENMNPFLEQGRSSCVEASIIYYLNQETSIDTEFDRIKRRIEKSILHVDPNWKNHSGAGSGVYFLTNNPSPVIIVDKSTYSKQYISIRHYISSN